jgi:hypothetical protein
LEKPLSGSDFAKSNSDITKSKPDFTKSDLQKRLSESEFAMSVSHFRDGLSNSFELKAAVKRAVETGENSLPKTRRKKFFATR